MVKYLKKTHKKMTPNELTKKTIQDSQSGKNIKKFNTIDELLKTMFYKQAANHLLI